MSRQEHPRATSKPPTPANQQNSADAPPVTARRTDQLAEKYFWHCLAVLSIVALLLRLIVLDDFLHNNPFARAPTVDGATYWNWALRIADGRWIGETPFFSSPLFPYGLGIVARLGAGLNGVYELQLGAHLLTAVLLASIARSRFGAAVGLVAVVLFFSLAEPVTFANRVLPSTLQLLLICLLWWQLHRSQGHPSLLNWNLSGAACGLLCLSYPPALLLLFLLGPWIYFQSPSETGRTARASLPVVVGLALISPAAVHNFVVSGEFIPLSAHSGITFFQGNSPGARGVFTEIEGITNSREVMHFDAAEMYRNATGRDGSWREVDRFLRNQGLAYLWSDPGQAVLLDLSKLMMFFTARTYDDILPVGDEIRAGLLHFTYLAPLATPWILGAALIGLSSLRRRLLYFAPEFAFFLLPLLVVVVFWYTPRYRFPAIPVVCVAAALIIVRAPSVSRKFGSVTALAAAIALGLLGEGVRQSIALDQPTGPQAHFSIKLAGSLALQDRTEEAIQTLEAEAERSPDNSDVWSSLASVLARAGRRAEAIEANTRALELDEKNRAAGTGLAILLIARNADGDLQASIEHLRACLGNSLYDPICYYGIGAALQKLDRLDEAAQAYRQALKARPDYEPARRALEALGGRTAQSPDGRSDPKAP